MLPIIHNIPAISSLAQYEIEQIDSVDDESYKNSKRISFTEKVLRQTFAKSLFNELPETEKLTEAQTKQLTDEMIKAGLYTEHTKEFDEEKGQDLLDEYAIGLEVKKGGIWNQIAGFCRKIIKADLIFLEKYRNKRKKIEDELNKLNELILKLSALEKNLKAQLQNGKLSLEEQKKIKDKLSLLKELNGSLKKPIILKKDDITHLQTLLDKDKSLGKLTIEKLGEIVADVKSKESLFTIDKDGKVKLDHNTLLKQSKEEQYVLVPRADENGNPKLGKDGLPVYDVIKFEESLDKTLFPKEILMHKPEGETSINEQTIEDLMTKKVIVEKKDLKTQKELNEHKEPEHQEQQQGQDQKSEKEAGTDKSNKLDIKSEGKESDIGFNVSSESPKKGSSETGEKDVEAPNKDDLAEKLGSKGERPEGKNLDTLESGPSGSGKEAAEVLAKSQDPKEQSGPGEDAKSNKAEVEQVAYEQAKPEAKPEATLEHNQTESLSKTNEPAQSNERAYSVENNLAPEHNAELHNQNQAVDNSLHSSFGNDGSGGDNSAKGYVRAGGGSDGGTGGSLGGSGSGDGGGGSHTSNVVAQPNERTHEPVHEPVPQPAPSPSPEPIGTAKATADQIRHDFENQNTVGTNSPKTPEGLVQGVKEVKGDLEAAKDVERGVGRAQGSTKGKNKSQGRSLEDY